MAQPADAIKIEAPRVWSPMCQAMIHCSEIIVIEEVIESKEPGYSTHKGEEAKDYLHQRVK
jgi:hypothetical protein